MRLEQPAHRRRLAALDRTEDHPVLFLSALDSMAVNNWVIRFARHLT